MSTYANVFVRVGDNFAPVASLSRNSRLGRSLCYAFPWEKIKSMSSEFTERILLEMRTEIISDKVSIEDLEKKRNNLFSVCSTLDEKIELYERYEEMIGEYKDDIEELNRDISLCEFFLMMMEEADYSEGLDKNTYLYCGVEIGNPTLEDLA